MDFRHLFAYCFYVVLRWIFNSVQSVILRLTGFNVNSSRHGNVAHSYRILYRMKRYDIDLASPTDFLAIHVDVKSLDYLRKVEVTLYAIDVKYAYFVYTELGDQIYKSNTAPFLYVAQFHNATHLIKIAISELVAFAELLGDPEGKVILISYTGRCGSTLLTQMFETTEHVTSISEPDVIMGPLIFGKDNPELLSDKVIRAIIRVICKPGNQKPLAYVIKPRCQTVVLADAIGKAAPFVKHIFVHRKGLDTVVSFINALGKTAGWNSMVLRKSMGLRAWTTPKLFDVVLVPTAEALVDSELAISTWSWASHLSYYFKAKEAGVPFVVVRYEDMVEDAEAVFARVLAHCTLPVELARIGVKAMNRDSQRGLSISRENVKKRIDKSAYSGSTKTSCDAICDALSVPRLDSEQPSLRQPQTAPII